MSWVPASSSCCTVVNCRRTGGDHIISRSPSPIQTHRFCAASSGRALRCARFVCCANFATACLHSSPPHLCTRMTSRAHCSSTKSVVCFALAKQASNLHPKAWSGSLSTLPSVHHPTPLGLTCGRLVPICLPWSWLSSGVRLQTRQLAPDHYNHAATYAPSYAWWMTTHRTNLRRLPILMMQLPPVVAAASVVNARHSTHNWVDDG